MTTTPTYTAVRTETALSVHVDDGVTTTPLRHLLSRSPDGFEWGYDGSGPFDLARSIIGDYLGVEDPADAFTRAVLDLFIASAPAPRWTITPHQLHQAMRHAAKSDPRVVLGGICFTPEMSTQYRQELDGLAFLERSLLRHCVGDWGDLDEHDLNANESALHSGSRLLSSYPIPAHLDPRNAPDQCIWVITEAVDDHGQRTLTTVLFPSEY